jgi:flagellar protein FlaG
MATIGRFGPVTPIRHEVRAEEATSRLVTRIVAGEGGELIREITSEAVLRIAERLDELQGRLILLEA